jgi:hypothetical protein
VNPLYQRLKELDHDTFQKLCFQLLKDKHPGANVRYVEGAAGDEGLDVFLGDLAGRLTVWQCKSFPGGVGKSQKQQIRDSLKRALKLKPKRWILCLSVDMDTKTHRWYQRLQKTHASNGVEIGLFQASEIVHELIHRRSLRNHFFAGAVVDPVELKRILSRSGELSEEELENVAEGNLEDFIERLKERDARFNYEIVFSGDRGPEAVPPAPRPGLVLSIMDGTKTINVFARDVEALEQDPPKVSVTIKGTGIEKFMSLVRTGMPQEFTEDELVNVTSNLTFLDPVQVAANRKLFVGPSRELTSKRLRTRLTFRAGSETVEYGFLELRPSRAGTEEVELVTANDRLAFELTLVVPSHQPAAGKIRFRKRFVGAEVHEAKKFLRAISLLREGGEIEVFDLERQTVFVRAKIDLDEVPERKPEFEDLIDELIKISDRFGVKLPLPGDISEQDLDSLLLLKTFVEGGTLPVNNISLVIGKSEENRETFPKLIVTEGAYRLEHQRQTPSPKLFGIEIDTGPCVICVDRARVKNLAETIRRFNEAEIGAGVPVSLEPLAPVRLMLLDTPTRSG